MGRHSSECRAVDGLNSTILLGRWIDTLKKHLATAAASPKCSEQFQETLSNDPNHGNMLEQTTTTMRLVCKLGTWYHCVSLTRMRRNMKD